MMRSKSYNISQLTQTLFQLSHACVIGNEGFPLFDRPAFEAICRIINVLERPTFDAVVGFMTIERREVIYDENHFELDMRKKRKQSREGLDP